MNEVSSCSSRSEADYFLGVSGRKVAEAIGRSSSRPMRRWSGKSPTHPHLRRHQYEPGGHSAKRRKIPIFHMEAGTDASSACPEELNRKVVDT